MDDAEVLALRSVFDGRVVKLTVERVRLPNGQTCELELIRHPGAAAVVPVDRENRVLLVRQYRHAVGGWIVEVPAGTLDPGEQPETCAAREVAEETGQQPGRLIPMGWIWTTPGFTDEKIWLFLALELVPVTRKLERDEVLSVVRLPLADAIERATRGEIRDAKSIAALLRAPHFLHGA